MQNFHTVFVAARFIVIELDGCNAFELDTSYSIHIDQKEYGRSNRVVTTLYDLEPDTDIVITLEDSEGTSSLKVHTERERITLDVRLFGAVGDGVADDTLAIQAAIASCPKSGRVWIPKGRYAIRSIFLKSDMTLFLDDGCVLSGSVKRQDYAILPGMIPPQWMEKEYNLGTWEGEPRDMFSALINGIEVENVVIYGKGTLDGNASYENWWKDFRTIVGACRPRMIFLERCKHVVLEGFTTQNTPSWNLHPYFSEDISIINLNIFNPKISPNTDGIDPESCNGVLIAGTYFSVGDDCIAIKSGKMYMGQTYKKTCQNIEIKHCLMKDGHGAVTIGSEIGAGVQKLHVHDCVFLNTDRGLRIKTRRGRGQDSNICDVVFENIRMDGVLSPFVVNSFYWDCDPDGHTDYVGTKRALPVDEKTPRIESLVFRHIQATNCHVCGVFVYGLPEQKIENLAMEDIYIDYTDNPQEEFPAMMAGVEKTVLRGIYVNNVRCLSMDDVQVVGQTGNPWNVYNIESFRKDGEIAMCSTKPAGDWIETS